MIDFPRDGVEYVTVTFTAYPVTATAVEASFDRVVWRAFDVMPAVNTAGDYVGKVLLRGPSAPGTTGFVIPAALTKLWVRVTDVPEVVPVFAGQVRLI